MQPSAPENSTISAFFVSFGTGVRLQAFLEVGTVQVSLFAEFADLGKEAYSNTWTETKGGKPDRIIMVGSHLDSVPAGPG